MVDNTLRFIWIRISIKYFVSFNERGGREKGERAKESKRRGGREKERERGGMRQREKEREI